MINFTSDGIYARLHAPFDIILFNYIPNVATLIIAKVWEMGFIFNLVWGKVWDGHIRFQMVTEGVI